MKKNRTARVYASALRADLVEHTKQRILEAVGDEIAHGDFHELSIDAVGRRARVAARTVYRHFPTKDDLLGAFWQWFLQRIKVADEPVSAAELPRFVERLYQSFDENEALLHGFIASRAGAEVRRASFPNRRRQIQVSLKEITDRMPPADARLALAAVHVFYSAMSWQTMRELWGLSGTDAGRAAAWGTRVLLDELRRNPKTLREDRR